MKAEVRCKCDNMEHSSRHRDSNVRLGVSRGKVMNSESAVVRPGFITTVLVVFSAATFWAVPFSPFVAMAAVVRTKNLGGWARKLAVASAVLSSVYTLAIASAVFVLTLYVLNGGY